jgi:hypothetical protein
MAKMQAGGTTRIFQVLSVLGIGIFFYWLYIASEPTEFLVAEDDVEEIEAVDLTAMEFANDPFGHEGERVRFRDAEVTQLLRQNVYFFRLGEEGVPLMVRMSDDVAAEPGFQPLPGDRGDLVGTLQEVTEDLLEQWNQAGVFREAEELLEAQTQQVYLFVTLAELRGADRPDDEAEPTDGDDDEAQAAG